MVYAEDERKSNLKVVFHAESVKVQKISDKLPNQCFALLPPCLQAQCCIPRYLVAYTRKYSACDLNDIPEQLLDASQSARTATETAQHTLDDFIFCKRMNIERRCDKSAFVGESH